MITMEIPVISRINGFEAGINCLQNPSFVSRLFHLAGIEKVSLNYSLWTWGALIVAFLATFSSVIARTQLLIFRLWRGRPVTSEHIFRTLVDDDDDEDESFSCSSSDDEDETVSEFENRGPIDEDFRVAGSRNCDEDREESFRLRHRRRRSSCEDGSSWSDFASSKSVVKLWDGLGLGFRNPSENVISMWDLNKDQTICSFFGGRCQFPAVSMVSPAVILSAGLENRRNAALRIWDARVGRQIPASFAEWQPRQRRITGVDSGGVEKVYVRDDASSVVVRDMRNLGLPLDSTEPESEKTWWDADAVILSDGECGGDGCFGKRLGNVGGSVVSRCRDAVKSYLFY
ncbi:PREDICTED: uncharacterized protein LOC104602168 [Nelumbo nucifera]|uniref:Uncharacterized protein n=2 Tax=Nelumbo nucifera TaxID=4432 RepID=A0A822Z1J2_NELNU|nr:PREDICTED: uncharacterized protein LOC104602168 [Nelumbo nucifera]DAD35368.1 TPA_asm: hypothetical protein HUJ06_006008 [Nelumbo nucifera]